MNEKGLRIGGPVLVSCASFVVVVAGLRAAQSIVVPFVVAAFIAMLCLPALRWLRERGLPTWAAFLLLSTAAVLFALFVAGVVGTSINQMHARLPVYQERIAELHRQAIDWLAAQGIDLDTELQHDSLDPQRAVGLFGSMLGALGAILSDTLVIVFTLIFMLLEAAEMPAKLRAIAGGDDSIARRFDTVQQSVLQYVSIKTQLSLLSAILISLWLWWLGVEFVLLWGLLVFLFSYVPNIGPFLAAVPAVMLALLSGGVPLAVNTAVAYLVVNLLMDCVLEPRLMGRGLGLSPLVVFGSLMFWGWVLGPVGMLFSVPLTMVVKIVLDHSEDMRWLAVLLGSEPPRPAARP